MIIIIEIQNHFGDTVFIKSFGEDNINTYNQINVYINNKKIQVIVDDINKQEINNRKYILKCIGPLIIDNNNCNCELINGCICFEPLYCYHISELLNYIYELQQTHENNNLQYLSISSSSEPESEDELYIEEKE